MDAGRPAAPLARKLGVRPGDSLLLAGAPAGFEVAGLPPDVLVRRAAGPAGPFDVALWYPVDRAELADRLAEFRAAMRPAAGLWVAWPKRASRVPTDLTEDVLREVALPTGLVDNKVCAVDATYSGLRLVIRRELRGR
ncbi:DUF3052 domain-containing protein [Kitasatospora sp. NPDC094015]|uniref:DUF3052 domain-containing protein n=1 Tax=Kitasatospora sp. NPDC094015 TaxID=3155205 RepID=UPI00331A2BEA